MSFYFEVKVIYQRWGTSGLEPLRLNTKNIIILSSVYVTRKTNFMANTVTI